MITFCVGFFWLLYGSTCYIEARNMFDIKLLPQKIDYVKNLNEAEIQDMLYYILAKSIAREFVQTKKRYSAEKLHHVQDSIKINPKEVILFYQIILKRKIPIATWCITFSKNAPEFLKPVDFLFTKEEEKDAMVYIGNLMNEEFKKFGLPLIEVNGISSASYNSLIKKDNLLICFYAVRVPDGYYTLIKQDIVTNDYIDQLPQSKKDSDELFRRYKDGTYDRQPGFGGTFTGMDWGDMEGND